MGLSAALVLLTGVAAWDYARTRDARVIDRAIRSTVVIRRETEYGLGTCSGVIVSKRGQRYKVLTAAHCVGRIAHDWTGGEHFSLVDAQFSVHDETQEGWSHPAALVLTGSPLDGHDFAVLSFEHDQDLPVSRLRVREFLSGERVFSVGAPMDMVKTPLFGAVARQLSAYGHVPHAVLFHLPGVEVGSSGSAVFDYDGRILALTVQMTYENSSVAIAIPAEGIFLGNL